MYICIYIYIYALKAAAGPRPGPGPRAGAPPKDFIMTALLLVVLVVLYLL